MEQKKRCGGCRFYSPYYTKGLVSFLKEKNGSCIYSSPIIVNSSDCCEKWQRKTYVRIHDYYPLKTLDKISDDVSQIRQIITENNENRQ